MTTIARLKIILLAITTVGFWVVVVGVLVVGVLVVGVLIGAQITHYETRQREENSFPCQFEDESKVISVFPEGNRSFCVPTDDLSVGISDSRGELEEVVTVDEYTYYISTRR